MVSGLGREQPADAREDLGAEQPDRLRSLLVGHLADRVVQAEPLDVDTRHLALPSGTLVGTVAVIFELDTTVQDGDL